MDKGIVMASKKQMLENKITTQAQQELTYANELQKKIGQPQEP